MYLKYLTLVLFGAVNIWCLTDQEYDLLPKLFYFDDFEKCLFHGSNSSLYCSVTVKIQPESFNYSHTVWKLIKEVNSDKNNYKHDLLRHGVCVKSLYFNQTIEEYLTVVYNKKYQHLGLNGKIVNKHCETKNSGYTFGTIDLFLAVFLGLYVVSIILISIYVEMFKRNKGNATESSKTAEFIQSFSLLDNWRHIANLKPYLEKEDFMLFVQGFRFCAIVGVVMTHALEINVVRPVQNPRYVEEMPTRFVTMILANGGMMVQIYFVISSFFLTISFLKKVRNGKKIQLKYILSSIVSRFVRLSSMYAVIIGLHSTWLVHLARGPFWHPIMGEDYRVCRKNWWKNLLYFNNFVINDGFCMFHSWYLSVDMQLYILGILLLWLTQRKPKLLLVGAGVLLLCHSGITFFNLAWNDWEIAVKLTPELMYYFGVVYSKEWQSTWTTTYSNLPGLASGLYFGYLYLKFKDQQLFTKMKIKILWWIFSWSLAFGPLIFSSYYMTTQYYSNSRWFAAAYGSFCQIVYTVGCGFVIFGMGLGVGGYVKKTLEWTPMHVLGQLSFGAYLIHFTLLKIDGASHMFPIYVSDYEMMNDVVTNMTLSYILSAVLTVFIQVPVIKLCKLTLG